MKALVWSGGRTVGACTVPVPSPPPGWVLVEVAYAGICGTDLQICAGEHPRAKPGLVIGHEFVGYLAGAVDGMAAGTPVFVNPLLPCGVCPMCAAGRPNVCDRLGFLGIDRDGGAAGYAAVPTAQLVPLPWQQDMRQAALIEPLAVALHAVQRGGVGEGHQAHVLGAGPIGLLVARCCRLRGASVVTVSEPAGERAARAQEAGFEVLTGVPDRRRADIVFDCTGHPSVAPVALKWAKTGGKVVTVGHYPGVVGVDLEELMFRELTLAGARAYTGNDVTAAVQVIGDEGLAASRLVTDVVRLEEAPEAIERLRKGMAIKVLLEGPAARSAG